MHNIWLFQYTIGFAFDFARTGCLHGGVKILLIGSGGREHAIAWRLSQSSRVTRLWCAPGNAGMMMERLANGAWVEGVDIAASDLPGLLRFANEMRPDLTVVGPDDPLALGIVDLFQKNGLRIWGPNEKAAQFESSKSFSQAFMARHGLPVAAGGSFSDPASAKAFAAKLGGRCVVKADGLALGKGVLLCDNLSQAQKAIDSIMSDRSFGSAGDKVVVQEFLEGMEISLHAICDGTHSLLFPTSQDHKRARDGDKGLNTGGMGTYSPTPFLSQAQMKEVEKTILQPWLAGCRSEGIDYRGILYPGVIITKEGPKILEFNARFGDPETQVYLPRLANDLVELFEATLDGTLNKVNLRWRNEAAVCVVMASGGYPGAYERGKVIVGLSEAARLPAVKVFHAGTRREGDSIVTNGGRVFGVTAWAENLDLARQKAYEAVSNIRFAGAFSRRDIGAKALAGLVSPYQSS